MKYLVGFCRTVVGILFIISGFIKLNDPVGFSFKLEEYFSFGVLNMPFFEPHALKIAIFVVILEVLLGVLLLIGFRQRFTMYSLLVMIIGFTFLTFYSAYFNKVTDCGCFGDALKLTPWQSFTKDIILLILIVIIVVGKRYVQPIFSPSFNRIVTGASLAACVIFVYYVLNHLPAIDFRPYKIGANIEEGMSAPEGAPKAIFDYAWKFKVDGEEKIIVTQGDYPTVDGEFIAVETTEVQEGYEPPIHDFTIEKDGVDYATELLQEPKLMMVIAYDLGQSTYSAFEDVKELTDKAQKAGYKVIGMSASGEDFATKLLKEYKLNFEFYFTDQTTLKTIVRSNPGVLILNKGTITQKKHYNDLDAITLE
ncbi:BT_3928 family protein [Cellulophaga sp. Z1A5H]|uniref:BT_3928 family protein n=1 Tax=Cellulophaga sp. Z1A5H TaxID=2687291 RepID=UPI0013FD99B0|nr:BT_3928 family protein [Cellulophaga sp. Z1A5H]